MSRNVSRGSAGDTTVCILPAIGLELGREHTGEGELGAFRASV